jgi:hypothetical protein
VIAPEFLDEHGNLVTAPDDGAVPDRRVRYQDVAKFIETWGERLDRLGRWDGEFFTVLGGTPDTVAALPEQEAFGWTSFRLTGRLPQGWQLEIGEVAPAYGRPGGARYVLVLSGSGQKLSVFEALDAGVIDVAAV